MKRLNRNGITLIELIVAIAIFMTIIFVGYSIFNKFFITTNTQGNINKGQLIMNNINDYITSDLENAEGITLICIEPNTGIEYTIENGESGKEEYLQNAILEIQQNNKILTNINKNRLVYQYIINTSDESKSPSYTVELSYEKDSSYVEYSIYREDNGEPKVDFITSYKTNKKGEVFEIPFTITKNNPYKVTLKYEENLNKSSLFEFEVASRHTRGSSNGGGGQDPLPGVPNPPTQDEIPIPPGFKDYGAVGYWTADSIKCITNNLYTWISDKGIIKGKVYGNQGVNQSKFDIQGNLHPGNEGQNESSKIGDAGIWKAQLPNNQYTTIEVNKNVEKISIYVSPYTTLEIYEFKVQGNGHNSNITVKDSTNIDNNQIVSGGTDINQGVWYECEINAENVNNLNIKGKISIDKSNIDSGYAFVVYGEESTMEKNDLIFEYLNLRPGQYSNQRNITFGTGYRNETGSYTYDRKEAINIDQSQLNGLQAYIHIKKYDYTLDTFMQPGGNPCLYLNNRKIYKKIENINKLRITMDGNISLQRADLSMNKIDDTTYEINVGNNSLSLNLYFNVSKLDVEDIKSGKVYIEFIE